MAVEKSNSILEARYGGELVGEIYNIFYPHVPFPPFSRRILNFYTQPGCI